MTKILQKKAPILTVFSFLYFMTEDQIYTTNHCKSSSLIVKGRREKWILSL